MALYQACIEIYIDMFCPSKPSKETPYQEHFIIHYDDVRMVVIASQITSLKIVYSIVYSDADQRKHQSSASLAFVRGIHRGPVNSPHKWPVTRKLFPFDDVIMWLYWVNHYSLLRFTLISCSTRGPLFRRLNPANTDVGVLKIYMHLDLWIRHLQVTLWHNQHWYHKAKRIHDALLWHSHHWCH